MKLIQNKARLILLGCIPLYGACSPSSPHTERQTSDTTSVLPSTSLLTSLNLTGQGTETIYFEGPLLFWKNDVSYIDMEKLLDEKDTIVKKELEYKPNAYQLDGLVKEFKSLKKEIDTLRQGGFFGSIDEKSKETIQKTPDWVKANILDHHPEDSTGRQAFNQFCQAYLWKAASSVMVRDFEYTQRPMVLSVCQEELKDYFTAEECSNPEDGTSKSYLSCFWGESGIQKTEMRYFKKSKGGTGRSKFEQVTDVEKQNILAYFQTDDWFNESDGIKQLLSSGVGLFKIKGDDGSKFQYFAAFTDIADLTEMKKFVIKSLTHQTSFKNFVVGETPINALDNLTGIISNGSYNYTLNDVMYNFNAQRKSDNPDYRAPSNAGDLEKLKEQTDLDPDNKNLFTEFTAEEIAKIETDILGPVELKQNSYEALEKTINDLDAKQTDKRKKWYDQKAKTVGVLLNKEMTEAIWAYSELRLIINGTKGEFLFRPAYAHREKYYFAKACIDLEKNASIPCESYQERQFPMKLEVDKESGKLSFDIEPEQDQKFYLSPFDPIDKDPSKQKYDEHGLPKVDTPFYQSELLTEEFLNKHRLRMEIFPDIYKNQIPRMTGKLFLYDKSGEKVLDGEFGHSKTDLRFAFDTIDKNN